MSDYTPTWYAGMYGCREDMFSRTRLSEIVADAERAAAEKAWDEAVLTHSFMSNPYRKGQASE